VQQHAHPLRDQWWQSLAPELGKITVPELVCGSFSDNNLHSRGSFRGFEHIASGEKFLYTHRSGKWATFYSPQARATPAGVLRPLPTRQGHPGGASGAAGGPGKPRCHRQRAGGRRLAAAAHPVDAGVPDRRRAGHNPPTATGQITFATHSHGACFEWAVPADTGITGPIALRLFAEAHDADDVDLYAGLEKPRCEPGSAAHGDADVA
jgi:uncharacterized protein